MEEKFNVELLCNKDNIWELHKAYDSLTDALELVELLKKPEWWAYNKIRVVQVSIKPILEENLKIVESKTLKFLK